MNMKNIIYKANILLRQKYHEDNYFVQQISNKLKIAFQSDNVKRESHNSRCWSSVVDNELTNG